MISSYLDARQDHLEDGEAAAQTLAGQQVALARDLGLLRVSVEDLQCLKHSARKGC